MKNIVALLLGAKMVFGGAYDYAVETPSPTQPEPIPPPQCTRGEMKMFYLEKSYIPGGWQICDGSNYTPDFRNKFPVAAGDAFPYNTMGGSKNYGYITLTADNVPAHVHNIKELKVSYSGDHYHAASGNSDKIGSHYHDAGDIETEILGGHDHKFSAKADKGGHIHTFNLNTNENGMHVHGTATKIENDGDHSHKFALKTDKGAHSHPISIDIGDSGNHMHSVDTKIPLEIPNHKHGAGSYAIKDHQFSHYHDVTGYSTKNGAHLHTVDLESSIVGPHSHDISAMIEKNGAHYHDAGDNLNAVKDGLHYHGVEKQATTSNGEHDHDVQAYFEADYDTVNEESDIAFDKVDIDNNGYPKATDEAGDHVHYVPAHNTLKAGEHQHQIAGKTAAVNDHGHDISITLKENGKHAHYVKGDTNKVDDHAHDIYGTTNKIDITLKHEFAGTCDAAGYFKSSLPIDVDTDNQGSHKHTATASMGYDSGNHEHVINGEIKSAGTHNHAAKVTLIQDGNHKHSVSGTIGGYGDGDHIHEVNGATEKQGEHNHKVNGKTAKNGEHSHKLEIMIEKAGDHTHTVSGQTEATYNTAKSFNVLPPWRSVYFICCVSEEKYYEQTTTEAPKY